MASHAHTPQRIARLRQELMDELGLELSDSALEELAYAKYMEPHEGQRAAYGAIVSDRQAVDSRPARLPLKSPGAFSDSAADLDVLRSFADGRTSFVVRSWDLPPTLTVDPAWHGNESTLASYAAESQTTVIQRLASGRVRVYTNDWVFSEQDGIWLARPSANRYFAMLADSLPAESHQQARAILDLCVHTLSPAGHGATLVWFPAGAEDLGEFLDDSVALNPPGLSASNPTHAAGIAHALGQMDRAVILDSDGRLVRLNVTLRHDESHSDKQFAGGTRHNSAGRYSASDHRAFVFVVSADGPVTVLYGGEIVAARDHLS